MCGAASRRFSIYILFALGVELSNSKLLRLRESNVLVFFRLA